MIYRLSLTLSSLYLKEVQTMASLNDIESQLDTIITDLSGGISSSTIFDLIVDDGAYTLSNDKTFDDITAELSAGKMPILRYVDDTTTYFLMPSITATADTAQMAWYNIRPVVSGDNVSIRILTIRENTDTTNKFIVFTVTLSE